MRAPAAWRNSTLSHPIAPPRAVLDPDHLRSAAGLLPGVDRRTVRIVRAPGRVNLIGEYTDFNDGLVMPAAIDLETRIAYFPTDDRRVELTLLSTGDRAGFDLDRLDERVGGWIEYVKGTAWALAEAGQPVLGLRGVVASNLPLGAGLSSSAALELVSAWALSGATPPALDPLSLARIAQRAENVYVGVNCGLMDQFAAACGVAGAALLFDCRSLAHRSIPLPLATHELVVIHTGSPHTLESSAYNERREQCERAVAIIAELEPVVTALRDVTPAMLERARPRLDDLTYRRARHVIAENVRVVATEAAFAAADLAAVGDLWAASHASLRDDFEVSSPELDALVEIAAGTPGVVAARLTGAGFGGSTINLVERDAVDRLRAAVSRAYPARTGLSATVIPVEPAAGAGAVVETSEPGSLRPVTRPARSINAVD